MALRGIVRLAKAKFKMKIIRKRRKKNFGFSHENFSFLNESFIKLFPNKKSVEAFETLNFN